MSRDTGRLGQYPGLTQIPVFELPPPPTTTLTHQQVDELVHDITRLPKR
ncbi:MAG: hypothetical protein NT062_26385 [Proteobacteria bacterium]|nr:hypothetical protein [Pseudomonadota bacterium]